MPLSCKSPGRVIALFADSNTDSFVYSITPFQEDWRPSQDQQEALLA